MHDVTPNVVPSAVRIDIRICTISFHVSFFIILYLLVTRFEACGAAAVVASTVVQILAVQRADASRAAIVACPFL